MYSKQIVVMALIGQISAVKLNKEVQQSKGEQEHGEYWAQIQSLAA